MTKTAEAGATAVRPSLAGVLGVTKFAGLAVAICLSFGAFFVSPSAHAELDSVGIGAGFAVPLGNAYMIYGRYPDFDGSVLLNLPSLGPDWKLIGTFQMSVATVNDTTVQQIRLWDYGIYGGLHYEEPLTENENHGLRPYMGLQIGAVYAVMGFNGVTTGTQNTGIEFATRFEPGFNYWATRKVGIGVGFPVDLLAVSNSLLIWNTVFSVRIKL